MRHCLARLKSFQSGTCPIGCIQCVADPDKAEAEKAVRIKESQCYNKTYCQTTSVPPMKTIPVAG
jgi:hypothetical protein